MPAGPVYLRCFGSCFKRLRCSCGAREVRNARRANGLFIYVDRILVRLDLVFFFFFSRERVKGLVRSSAATLPGRRVQSSAGCKSISVEKEQFV